VDPVGAGRQAIGGRGKTGLNKRRETDSRGFFKASAAAVKPQRQRFAFTLRSRGLNFRALSSGMVELRPGRRPRIDMSQTLSVRGADRATARHFLAEERMSVRRVMETAGRPHPPPRARPVTQDAVENGCALVISRPPTATEPRQRASPGAPRMQRGHIMAR
jgi:hypothetical protein